MTPARSAAPIDYPTWLTTAQAARYLGVTTRTLHEVAVPGGLPCYRFGRVFRFKLDDLQTYISGTRVVPQQEEQA